MNADLADVYRSIRFDPLDPPDPRSNYLSILGKPQPLASCGHSFTIRVCLLVILA